VTNGHSLGRLSSFELVAGLASSARSLFDQLCAQARDAAGCRLHRDEIAERLARRRISEVNSSKSPPAAPAKACAILLVSGLRLALFGPRAMPDLGPERASKQTSAEALNLWMHAVV
jgi:hypothetical protein